MPRGKAGEGRNGETGASGQNRVIVINSGVFACLSANWGHRENEHPENDF